MNHPGQKAVSLQDLSITAGTKTILAHIQLEIPPGEAVAVVGRNGAGKSTLLKSLTGMVQPSHGQIEVLGRKLERPISREELRMFRSEIGQIFQGLHLVGRLTTLENVLIGKLADYPSILSWARIFPKHHRDAAMEALEQVGLADKADIRADHLSGGERQKAAIARVLLQEAKLVLADEPTASLDPQASRSVSTLLRELCIRKKFTLITVVHSLSLLPILSERVIGLHDGQIKIDSKTCDTNEDEILAVYGGALGGST